MTAQIALLAASLLPLRVLHRAVHYNRIGVTPLAAFLSTWWIVVALYLWNPLNFYSASVGALLTVLVGLSVFVVGYAIPTRVVRRARRAESHLVRAGIGSDRVLFWSMCACVAIGTVLFVLYTTSLGGFQGILSNVHQTLYETRVNLGNGEVPLGFYFFDFFELAVPLATVLWTLRRQVRYLFVAALCAIPLLLTTGRTDFIVAVLWAFACLVLLRGSRRSSVRQTVAAGAVGLLVLASFVMLGDALGKSYANSNIRAYFGVNPPIPEALVLPAQYLTGLLPTYSAIMAHEGPSTSGALTFRPFLLVAHALDPEIRAPSKIEPEYPIPIPFNVGTYLASFWQDGGLVGICLGSLATGWLCGAAFASWHRRRTPMSLVLAGFFTIVALRTVVDSTLNDFSTILQLLVLAVGMAIEARTSKMPAQGRLASSALPATVGDPTPVSVTTA